MRASQLIRVLDGRVALTTNGAGGCLVIRGGSGRMTALPLPGNGRRLSTDAASRNRLCCFLPRLLERYRSVEGLLDAFVTATNGAPALLSQRIAHSAPSNNGMQLTKRPSFNGWPALARPRRAVLINARFAADPWCWADVLFS